MKAKKTVTDLSVNVTHIKRTQKGELLLKLKARGKSDIAAIKMSLMALDEVTNQGLREGVR